MKLGIGDKFAAMNPKMMESTEFRNDGMPLPAGRGLTTQNIGLIDLKIGANIIFGVSNSKIIVLSLQFHCQGAGYPFCSGVSYL